MIEVKNLTRRYGDLVAVDGVSFSVGDGEIVGMLGPNGAGKTTAIRMITGFLPPTSGEVRVAGHDLFEDPVAVRMWQEERWDVIPNGEPADRFEERVRDAIERIATVHCDELVSLHKSRLTDYVGSLSHERRRALDRALGTALGLR